MADAGPAFEVMYEQIHRESRNYLEKVLDPDSMLLEFYKVPTFEIDGKRYIYAIGISSYMFLKLISIAIAMVVHISWYNAFISGRSSCHQLLLRTS